MPVTRQDEPTDLSHDEPEDACTTASYRLNVILTLVEDGAKRADDLNTDNEEDDGGYGLMAACEMIRDLRDYLRRAVRTAEAARQNEGGAR